MLTGSFKIP